MSSCLFVLRTWCMQYDGAKTYMFLLCWRCQPCACDPQASQLQAVATALSLESTMPIPLVCFALQGRVQSVCQQLQADIARMKAQRASVQRRMEAKEKEFRWVGLPATHSAAQGLQTQYWKGTSTALTCDASKHPSFGA